MLLRQVLRPREWRFHPKVDELIWQKIGSVELDLFASEESTHCPYWLTLTPSAPLGLDAMVQEWPLLQYIRTLSLCHNLCNAWNVFLQTIRRWWFAIQASSCGRGDALMLHHLTMWMDNKTDLFPYCFRHRLTQSVNIMTQYWVPSHWTRLHT